MRDDDFVMALGRHGAPHAGLTRLIPVAGKGVPPRSGRRPPRGAEPCASPRADRSADALRLRHFGRRCWIRRVSVALEE